MTAPDREREAREREAILELSMCYGALSVDPTNDGNARRVEQALYAYRDVVQESRDSAWRAAIEEMRKERPAKASVPRDEGGGEWLQCVACELDEHDCLCKHETESWNAALAALAERMGT